MMLAANVSAQTIRHVDDQAAVLSSSEAADLENRASALFDRYGFDVLLHTTNDSLGKGPQNYSADFYHEFRDPAAYPDGAIFAIMFDTRDYYETARGRGIDLLSSQTSDDLSAVVQRKLSDGDYHGAMVDYLAYVERLLMPSEPASRLAEPLENPDALLNQALLAFLSLTIVGVFLSLPQLF